MKKRIFLALGMTVFLLSGCVGKEETVQTEQLEVPEMTEMQEMFVMEAETVENTETFTEETEQDRRSVQSTEYVENPDNLPVLTGNETEEGLYWDSQWQHETYVEFGPDGDVYFDKYGNTYSCPVDAEGNLIIE